MWCTQESSDEMSSGYVRCSYHQLNSNVGRFWTQREKPQLGCTMGRVSIGAKCQGQIGTWGPSTHGMSFQTAMGIIWYPLVTAKKALKNEQYWKIILQPRNCHVPLDERPQNFDCQQCQQLQAERPQWPQHSRIRACTNRVGPFFHKKVGRTPYTVLQRAVLYWLMLWSVDLLFKRDRFLNENSVFCPHLSRAFSEDWWGVSPRSTKESMMQKCWMRQLSYVGCFWTCWTTDSAFLKRTLATSCTTHFELLGDIIMGA